MLGDWKPIARSRQWYLDMEARMEVLRSLLLESSMAGFDTREKVALGNRIKTQKSRSRWTQAFEYKRARVSSCSDIDTSVCVAGVYDAHCSTRCRLQGLG
jgi:hypothetical protein